MSPLVQLIVACLLFALGLRLSAFFSGSETGFYRASFLRINIDAQAGDAAAQRLLWFARNPSAFVATTLVGNNVANYLTTLAIGLGTFSVFQNHAEWLEILGTLLIAPVVFVCGELLPKNLYYRAPLFLLRRDAKRLVFFYYLFLAVSFPLIAISKLFERLGRGQSEQTGLVLGRSRLVQVLSQGHREGILREVQTRLVRGVMNIASQSVQSATTPSARVLGLPENSSRAEILEFARRYGITVVPIRKTNDAHGWFGYVRVVDLSVSRKPVSSMLYPMPRIPATSGKLETLLELRESDMDCGVVVNADKVIGVVSAHGLVEQLFRPPHVLDAHQE
jgi:CBS domain containing-hemolysin-like protein